MQCVHCPDLPLCGDTSSMGCQQHCACSLSLPQPSPCLPSFHTCTGSFNQRITEQFKSHAVFCSPIWEPQSGLKTFISWALQPTCKMPIMVRMLQMSELRHWEYKWCHHGHTGSQWLSQGSRMFNPLTPRIAGNLKRWGQGHWSEWKLQEFSHQDPAPWLRLYLACVKMDWGCIHLPDRQCCPPDCLPMAAKDSQNILHRHHRFQTIKWFLAYYLDLKC